MKLYLIDSEVNAHRRTSSFIAGMITATLLIASFAVIFASYVQAA